MRKVFALTTIVLLAGIMFAQDKTVTLDGYLMDNACAESAKDIGARAKTHSVSCSLMDGCEKSGYAVFAGEKLYKLDDKGNASAEELLKNTKTKKGVHVKVEGTVDGDTVKVSKLTEVMEAIN